ncbi:hypothetical protein BaRGS_00029012 [Batillaria attramentaria]|uniref:Uncharacterized protein n=1 Tax=Batillaria attramentaria TaxID=370345 RepID=A0ABD0JXH3_9CAEN
MGTNEVENLPDLVVTAVLTAFSVVKRSRWAEWRGCHVELVVTEEKGVKITKRSVSVSTKTPPVFSHKLWTICYWDGVKGSTMREMEAARYKYNRTERQNKPMKQGHGDRLPCNLDRKGSKDYEKAIPVNHLPQPAIRS